jgi:hypothetical protein
MRSSKTLLLRLFATTFALFPAFVLAQGQNGAGQAQPAGAQQQRQSQGQNQGQDATQDKAQNQAQAQAAAQANPEIERQRQQAEQQGKQSLDRDAIAAIEETRRAIQAIDQGKNDEALAAIERATGKINILVGRNPAAALIPVGLQVDVIDAAPLDVKAIRARAKAAERAVDDKDYPAARVLLAGLVSELRVRTVNLPLLTYPIAMQDAARLLDQQKKDEAKALLQAALNTLAIIDRVTPLPLVVAEAAITDAQAKSSQDKNEAQRLLSVARAELDRAKELGYAGKDPEYAALNQAISDLEKQLKGNQNTSSAFARLKEKVSSFFHRQSQNEKKAEVVSR